MPEYRRYRFFNPATGNETVLSVDIDTPVIDLIDDVARAIEIHDGDLRSCSLVISGIAIPKDATLRMAAAPPGSTIHVKRSGRRQAPDVTVTAFLCHATEDKPRVRQLYLQLTAERIRPWFDERDLLPGQDWEREICSIVARCDVCLVCLSNASISRDGFVHKEIRVALDAADLKPEDAIYIIPVKLEPCEIPSRLRRWHWVNLFESDGFSKLIAALKARSVQVKKNRSGPQHTT